jgi:hypothetical protein
MEPQEILPVPESKNLPDNLGMTDVYNEASQDMAVEHKQGQTVGHGQPALSGVAVNAAAVQLQQSQASIANDVGGTASGIVQIDVPEVANDIDLIEKEWVQKAKAIVESTQGDPYMQNKQINRMKVEYIKKRYDKDIVVGKD